MLQFLLESIGFNYNYSLNKSNKVNKSAKLQGRLSVGTSPAAACSVPYLKDGLLIDF
jgi:hypothetical protein